MFKIQRELELILLIVVAAICSNFANDLVVFKENFMVFNQMLIFTALYLCIAGLLEMKSNYTRAIHIGNFFIVIVSGMLYYSRTIIDFMTLGVCLYSVISTIIYLKDKRSKEEQ